MNDGPLPIKGDNIPKVWKEMPDILNRPNLLREAVEMLRSNGVPPCADGRYRVFTEAHPATYTEIAPGVFQASGGGQAVDENGAVIE